MAWPWRITLFAQEDGAGPNASNISLNYNKLSFCTFELHPVTVTQHIKLLICIAKRRGVAPESFNL